MALRGTDVTLRIKHTIITMVELAIGVPLMVLGMLVWGAWCWWHVVGMVWRVVVGKADEYEGEE
jgi:hypothetical protein